MHDGVFEKQIISEVRNTNFIKITARQSAGKTICR